MSSKNIIGKRLRAARERTEYSQKKLGIALGVDTFSVSPRINHYEQGRHQPDFQTVQKLAKETLIYSEFLVAQGCATIFQTRKCLKNEEKQKSHFLFFVL